MSIGDVCPKESEKPPQTQDQPSSSMQASPPTQDEDEAQNYEGEDQGVEPPQEESNDQGGDTHDQDEEEKQATRPPHPRVHQAIQRDHPVNTILSDIQKGVTTLSTFRDRGVPEPTSECAACPSPDGSSAWASAKGGEARWPETGVREVEIPRPSCSSRAQVSRGVTSVHAGEGSEWP
jgi:hypothetical protein